MSEKEGRTPEDAEERNVVEEADRGVEKPPAPNRGEGKREPAHGNQADEDEEDCAS